MRARAWMGLAGLCMALGLVFAPAAEAGAKQPLCLSLEERAELADLMARYAVYADGGAGEAFAALFTPDGELVIRDQVVHGRSDLAAMINRKTNRTLHLPSAAVLVKTADGHVRARSQLLFMREVKAEGGAVATMENGFAVYEDAIVKTPQGWKFTRRRAAEVQPITPEFLPEQSSPVCRAGL